MLWHSKLLLLAWPDQGRRAGQRAWPGGGAWPGEGRGRVRVGGCMGNMNEMGKKKKEYYHCLFGLSPLFNILALGRCSGLVLSVGYVEWKPIFPPVKRNFSGF